MSSSLGPWQRVTKGDIPAQWRGQQEAARLLSPVLLTALKARLGVPPEATVAFDVVLELPDYPICRLWTQWYTGLDFTVETDLVHVMITAKEQWRERAAACSATLRSLMREGKPTPVWAASWRRVA
jgi:hypothetical protein